MSRVEPNPKGYNFQVPVTSGHEHEAKAPR
jgi:hypothetical protein